MLEKSRKQANRCLHAAAECAAQLGPNTPECENEGRGECISFFFALRLKRLIRRGYQQ